MSAGPELIGREAELDRLAGLAASAGAGRGALVLLAGEAGAGKTALARAGLAASGFRTLQAACLDVPGPPYRPIASLLRAHGRESGELLAGRPGLRAYLACVLPELGPPAADDQAAVFEAVAAAFAEMAASRPLAALVDDLHWSDEATLDLLRFLAEVAEGAPLLLVGAYRSDAVGRTHPLRRLRSDLRRAGRLHEVAVEPLDREGTGLLLERVLGAPVLPGVVADVHERTEGLPFFVEELAPAIRETGEGPARPLPESVRDAVMARVNALPDPVRLALGAAAVVGQEFDLGLVADLQEGPEGLDRLADCGLLLDLGQGRWAFRHALIREVIHADLSWSRRRALHRAVAERLEEIGAPPIATAGHWLAVGERERGRLALLAAAEAAGAASAHRDAASALSRALDLWPGTGDAGGRLHALERLASSAELFGDAALSALAWGEAAEGLEAAGATRRLGEARRRLANALELQGAWERALDAHQSAAEAFAACGEAGEAAAERLAAAARLRSAASFRAALGLLAAAAPEAERAGRADLTVRILALEGNVRCRMGDVDLGLERARAALDLALAQGQAGAAGEAYQRLADSLEHAGDYGGARATYLEATSFCRANAAAATADLCLACLTWVLRQLGEWEGAAAMCREVLASPASSLHACAAAHGVLGSIEVLQGRATVARPHLQSGGAIARQIHLAAMELDTACALARLDELRGRPDAAVERCEAILRRWERTDCERHYSVPVLRWMATLGAEHDAPRVVHGSTAALARIAAGSGAGPEALAALAHALGETAMLQRDAAGAAGQFEQALAVGAGLDLPLERAEIERRAGAALAASGRRSEALDRLVSAHRTARRLGARPLAARVAAQVAALGERVDRRLGRVAAARAAHGGLSRREVEVARLVASGRTSREIASDLHLSARTVEMHVHNVLVKLDCRSRVDVARRAAELGLLGS